MKLKTIIFAIFSICCLAFAGSALADVSAGFFQNLNVSGVDFAQQTSYTALQTPYMSSNGMMSADAGAIYGNASTNNGQYIYAGGGAVFLQTGAGSNAQGWVAGSDATTQTDVSLPNAYIGTYNSTQAFTNGGVASGNSTATVVIFQ